MLEQFELAVGSLGKDGCAERLHDLLDGDILVGELIARRAFRSQMSVPFPTILLRIWVRTHQTRPKAPMPTGCKSEYLRSGISGPFSQSCARGGCALPRGDLKGGAKDLGTHELGHVDGYTHSSKEDEGVVEIAAKRAVGRVG